MTVVFEKFTASKRWRGARPGYVFRTSKEYGTGYHLENEPFVASDEWRGARPGYVFRKSTEFGLGYHLDDAVHKRGGSDDATSKRRRTYIPPVQLSPEQLHGLSATMNSLSNDNLVMVSDYLPKTSRALLAVALTAPTSRWRELGWKGVPNGASKAIISSVKPSTPSAALIETICKDESRPLRGAISRKKVEVQLREYYEGGNWEILDFVDIEKSLASRLNDDDVGAMLASIDSKHTLKRLNLTHCFGVVGHGLSPLSSSLVLEKIDMGLARQCEVPEADFRAKISDSEEAVLPILQSIFGEEGNSFSQLQLPRMWCLHAEEHGSIIEQLLRNHKHERVFNRKSLCCYFGLDCTPKDFVSQIGDKYSGNWDMVDKCFCGRKEFYPCEHCDDIFCKHCDGQEFYTCEDCCISSCRDCSGRIVEETDENAVQPCGSMYHGEHFCTECRTRRCREGTIDHCEHCFAMSFHAVLDENDVQRTTILTNRAEIDRLRHENEAQRAEIERLRHELEEQQQLAS